MIPMDTHRHRVEETDGHGPGADEHSANPIANGWPVVLTATPIYKIVLCIIFGWGLLHPAAACATDSLKLHGRANGRRHSPVIEQHLEKFYREHLGGIDLSSAIDYPKKPGQQAEEILAEAGFIYALGKDAALVLTFGGSEPLVNIIDHGISGKLLIDLVKPDPGDAIWATEVTLDTVESVSQGATAVQIAGDTAKSFLKDKAIGSVPVLRTAVAYYNVKKAAGQHETYVRQLIQQNVNLLKVGKLAVPYAQIKLQIESAALSDKRKIKEYHQVLHNLIKRYAEYLAYKDAVLAADRSTLDGFNTSVQYLFSELDGTAGQGTIRDTSLITRDHGIGLMVDSYVRGTVNWDAVELAVMDKAKAVAGPYGSYASRTQRILDQYAKPMAGIRKAYQRYHSATGSTTTYPAICMATGGLAIMPLGALQGRDPTFGQGTQLPDFVPPPPATNTGTDPDYDLCSFRATGTPVIGGLPSEVLDLPTGQNISTDQARMLLPYAELSLSVYGRDTLPDGWKEISPKQRLVTRLKVAKEGFHAAAYQGPGGEVVVAFEGTNPLSPADWINNFGHTVDIPKQYEMALAYAKKIMSQAGSDRITLTGHSLGGGLAQYAGGMLGLRTITFNHAGLWAPTYFKIKLRGQADAGDFTHVVTQGFRFKKSLFVKSQQDPVSKWGIRLGDIVRVPMESPGWVKGFFYRHGMANLRDAIKAIADVPSRLAVDQTIIAVVDSSGSMSTTDPNDLRKAALRMMIDTLDDTAALGLIDFDNATRQLTEPVAMGKFNSATRQRLKKMVAGIDSAGGTNIGAGLALAAKMVPRNGSQVTLVLLTDGKDKKWKGQGDALPAGVAVHTIALSDKADRVGLGKLAAATGGVAEIARNADDLARIISNLFGEATGQEVLLVKTGTISQGDDIFHEVFVDSGYPHVTFQADWRGSDIDLFLIDPTGRRYDTASAVSTGIGIEAANYDIIRVARPQPGRWQVHLLGVQLPAGGEPYTFRVTSNESAVKTRWKVSMPVAEVGTPLVIDLATQGDVQWANAHIETWLPDGRRHEQTRPIGGLASALGGDSGESVLNFVPSQPGVHQVRITVTGRTPTGETIQRSFDRTLRVAAPGKGERYRQLIDPFIRRTPGMLR